MFLGERGWGIIHLKLVICFGSKRIRGCVRVVRGRGGEKGKGGGGDIIKFEQA